MARELCAIKIKIGLRPNGHADHPDFNLLPVIQNAGMDWSYWVDQLGIGWHYDKVCGHKEDEVGSPAGMQWGMLVVPEQFAIEAVAAFPNLITHMTEVDCEAFYNDRCHAHENDVLHDDRTLTALDTELRLVDAQIQTNPADQRAKDDRSALIAKVAKARDPNDPQPGVKKNHNRYWVDVKARRGVRYKEIL